MARMGMDVEAVESIAKGIQSDADRLGQLTTSIEALVRRLPGLWEGADAMRFVNDWWPQHRKTLGAVQESVRGLGQSALNNASEQRQASGVSSSNGGGPAAPTAPTAPAPIAVDAGRAAAVTSWGDGVVGRAFDVDHSDGVQCVDLVKKYVSDTVGVPENVSGVHGNADEIYANASSQYFDKIPVGGTPQPGDIVCVGPNGYSPDYGHVAVVESVSGGTLHLIEQSGADPARGTFRGTLSSVEVAAIQGYLRPKG